jgi:hypothetical protein
MRQILSRSLLTAAAASSILAVTGGYATADSEAQGAAVGSPGVLSGNTISAPVDVPVNACGNTVDVVALVDPAFGNGCANVSEHEHRQQPQGRQEHRGHQEHHGPRAPGRSAGGGGTSGSAGRGGRAPGDSKAPGSRAADSGAPGRGSHGPGPRHTGAVGQGAAVGSPGVLSGNDVAAPVQAPVNACGNTVDVVGLLNPVFGNNCANVSGGSPVGTPRPPAPQPPHSRPPAPGRTAPRPSAVNPGGPERPSTAPHAVRTADRADSHDGSEPRLARTGFDGREAGAAGATSIGLLLGGMILYRRGRREMARTR